MIEFIWLHFIIYAIATFIIILSPSQPEDNGARIFGLIIFGSLAGWAFYVLKYQLNSF